MVKDTGSELSPERVSDLPAHVAGEEHSSVLFPDLSTLDLLIRGLRCSSPATSAGHKRYLSWGWGDVTS